MSAPDNPAERKQAQQANGEPTPLIIDVDTGCDDALALLLALRCPSVRVLAVTCVHGNVGVDQVLANTLKVLDAATAPPDLPVARGFGEPLVEPPTHCPQIHGNDGLGDLEPALAPSRRQPRPGHAVELLNRTLREAESKVTVVCLAPLTNVAVAIRTEPELWRSKVARLVWMGGAAAAGGNASAWAEANARYDPEAAHMVLSSGLPLLIYPWDVFLKVGYTEGELRAMGIADVDAGGAGAETGPPRHPASVLAGRLFYREMRRFKTSQGTLGDAGAVAAALKPEALTVRKLHVAVELHGGLTRGMTVCDLREFVDPPDEPQRPANAEVVMDVDAEALKELFTRHVLAPQGVADGGQPAKRCRTA